ncbi:hypothetical protein [Glycomyces sp. NPDC047010]|uniref:hypothetical protein n=1 Tax=Glycomyces sp. NPDC047010 TaxID=3155023 RepID=UPI0033FE3C19
MPTDTATRTVPADEVTAEEWARLLRLARAAARHELATWPRGLVEADDLAQDLMTELARDTAATRSFIDGFTTGALKKVLRIKAYRAAHAAAEARRRFHGSDFYTVFRVRALLEEGIGLIPGAATEARGTDGAYTVGFAEAADLTAALGLVADHHRDALTAKFGPVLANAGTPAPTASQVSRAVRALTYLLNNLAEERTRMYGATTRP